MTICRKKFLYHVTSTENVENILKYGLVRERPEKRSIAVYLSEKPLSWYQPGLALLRVDISGLDDIHATTFLPESDEILFWGDIPPIMVVDGAVKQRIEDVTSEIDHFRDAAKMLSEEGE